MSTIKAANISNLAGKSTSMDNAINGSAKAWVNFNGTGTVAINSSFNISSLTDGGVGIYSLNFTTPLSDSNYSVVGVTNSETADLSRPVLVCFIDTSSTSSSAQVRTVGTYNNNSRYDVSCCTVSIFR